MKLPASRPGSMKRFSYRRLNWRAAWRRTRWFAPQVIKYTPSLCLRSTVHEFKELFAALVKSPRTHVIKHEFSAIKCTHVDALSSCALSAFRVSVAQPEEPRIETPRSPLQFS